MVGRSKTVLGARSRPSQAPSSSTMATAVLDARPSVANGTVVPIVRAGSPSRAATCSTSHASMSAALRPDEPGAVCPAGARSSSAPRSFSSAGTVGSVSSSPMGTRRPRSRSSRAARSSRPV
ncbi:hypothetical protein LUX73_34910 [Actinomadura madurae]|nr:hypothetical protein [Actinomadura madurae]MCQ0009391.1 hypothetical protein [Actinomadura madurae]